jgi:hypothetical protein
MSAIRFLSAATLTFATLAAYAQAPDAPQPSAAVAPPTTSAKSDECAVARKARHDHGVERGQGPMSNKACAPMKSAKAGEKEVTGHDHGKFHKNQ